MNIALPGDVQDECKVTQQADYFRFVSAVDLRTTKGVPVCSAN